MNKKDIKEQIKKLAENPLVQQAAGVLEFTAGLYKQLPSGLLVPLKKNDFKPGTVVTQLSAESAKMAEEAFNASIKDDKWNVTYGKTNAILDPNAVGQLMGLLQKKAEEKTGVSNLYPGKVFFEDAPVKFEDGQQVPAHIANDPDISPVPYTPPKIKKTFSIWANDLKPTDYNVLGVVAYELAHQLYKENPEKASITTESGIEITNSLLEEPSFTHHLKIALIKHTEKQKQAAAMAKAAAAHPPPASGELDVMAVELAKVMGMTEDEYKKWMVGTLPQKAEPVAITQGAFNMLLKPGLAASFKDYYVGFSVTDEMLKDDLEMEKVDPKNQLSDVELSKMEAENLAKMDKAISYAAKFGIAKLTDKFVTAEERIRVLESIVAGILLAPREMVMKDDSFVVSPKVMTEMANSFRLKVVKKKGDYHITLE